MPPSRRKPHVDVVPGEIYPERIAPSSLSPLDIGDPIDILEAAGSIVGEVNQVIQSSESEDKADPSLIDDFFASGALTHNEQVFDQGFIAKQRETDVDETIETVDQVQDAISMSQDLLKKATKRQKDLL